MKNVRLTNSKAIYFLAIIFLLLYSFLVVDPIAEYYNVSGFQRSFKRMSFFEVIGVILIMPIVEEFIFRGYLNGLRDYYWYVFIQYLLCSIILIDFVFVVILIFFIQMVMYLIEAKVNSKSRYISKPLMIVSCISTSLLFSAIHYPSVISDSPTFSIIFSVFAIFPGALFLGLARYRMGLTVAIISHSVLNALTLFLNGLVYVN